MDCNAI